MGRLGYRTDFNMTHCPDASPRVEDCLTFTTQVIRLIRVGSTPSHERRNLVRILMILPSD